jgi:hypothetical protein
MERKDTRVAEADGGKDLLQGIIGSCDSRGHLLIDGQANPIERIK